MELLGSVINYVCASVVRRRLERPSVSGRNARLEPVRVRIGVRLRLRLGVRLPFTLLIQSRTPVSGKT